jgi:carbamoyl-phosphate synthase large subunit
MLTSVGQRVDIARAFQAAGATTLGVDADELAPALYHCDRRVLVPRIADPAYVPALAALREEHDVRLVVPLNDLDFPVLVKAREGFGSRNIFFAGDRAQLDFYLDYSDVPSFVQEQCLGEEFSIDVFCDMDARCLNAIPRTMLLSKGGESIKGASIHDVELIEHGARVAEVVGIKGPATVQCFREPDGSLPITDVNTRFGGGFPVPLAAGGRYPELALALARGERPDPRVGDFEGGVVMTRYFSEVCLAPGADGALAVVHRP